VVTATPPRRRSRWPWLLSAVLFATAALPIATYVAGKRVVGTYEGKYGLTDYLGSITSGAARGEAPAWILLATPAAIALVWLLVAWSWRRARP
jgi:hypothetical protein